MVTLALWQALIRHMWFHCPPFWIRDNVSHCRTFCWTALLRPSQFLDVLVPWPKCLKLFMYFYTHRHNTISLGFIINSYVCILFIDHVSKEGHFKNNCPFLFSKLISYQFLPDGISPEMQSNFYGIICIT